jgi:hypothetical protein
MFMTRCSDDKTSSTLMSLPQHMSRQPFDLLYGAWSSARVGIRRWNHSEYHILVRCRPAMLLLPMLGWSNGYDARPHGTTGVLLRPDTTLDRQTMRYNTPTERGLTLDSEEVRGLRRRARTPIRLMISRRFRRCQMSALRQFRSIGPGPHQLRVDHIEIRQVGWLRGIQRPRRSDRNEKPHPTLALVAGASFSLIQLHSSVVRDACSLRRPLRALDDLLDGILTKPQLAGFF